MSPDRFWSPPTPAEHLSRSLFLTRSTVAGDDAPSQKKPHMCQCVYYYRTLKQFNAPSARMLKKINTMKVFSLGSCTRRQSSFCPSTMHRHQGTFVTRRSIQEAQSVHATAKIERKNRQGGIVRQEPRTILLSPLTASSPLVLRFTLRLPTSARRASSAVALVRARPATASTVSPRDWGNSTI